MQMVVGGHRWAGGLRRTATRYHSSLFTGHLSHSNTTQHLSLTSQSVCQNVTYLRPSCVAYPFLPGQVLSKSVLQTEAVRCFHTGKRQEDQMKTSIDEQSSCESGPCESSLVKVLVERWTRTLSEEQVPEPDLGAQHIMAHVLGVTRSELQQPSTAERNLTKNQLDDLDRLMNCRLARMPVQYIVGEWDFHNITLKVKPPVFIPRLETEQLVELALGTLKEMESPRVLEFCCGSGAISLALLQALPQLECVAVDQSRHAVQLTEANAEKLGVKERLTVVKEKVDKDTRPSLPHSSYDLVVANPPYVLRKDLMELQPEIMMYEDLRALDGGKDGLKVMKAVVLHAHHLLLPGRKLLLEVDSCHPYLLPAWLAKQNLHLKLLQVHQGFNNQDRFMEFIKEV